MITRLVQIHEKFGFGGSARIVLLLVGLIGMSLFGIFGFESWWPLAIAIGGLAVGIIVRRRIVESFDWFSWVLPGALFVYGVLLFIGERVGLSREAQLTLITLTTVVVFDIQFWSLSDPSIGRASDR